MSESLKVRSTAIAILCEQCGYSRHGRCATGPKVCLDCGAESPSPTDEQRATVRYFTAHARETGATIHAELDEGLVWITEQASAEWDCEITRWLVRASGDAEIQ